jgi:hypothetical protein
MIRLIFVLLIAAVSFSCKNQSKNERFILGKEFAKKELNAILKDRGGKPMIAGGGLSVIKDSITAVAVAEAILFNIYGKQEIIYERPYEIYLISNHWVLMGTLPKGSDGGTFLIILDAKDSRVLKMTHGK